MPTNSEKENPIILTKNDEIKTVYSEKEAEKLENKGWRRIESSEDFGIGFSRDGIVKLASANLQPWQAFNEFIANSIDSWIAFPKKPRPKLIINIDIEQKTNLSKSKVILSDNALGMSKESLGSATKEFLGSVKSKGKNSHLYLGMFGFGLFGSAFLLGKSLDVITTEDNKTHSKFTISEDEYVNEEKDANIIEMKPDSVEKKLFKKSGTRIIISDFKNKLAPAVLSDYLKLSWKYYLVKNHLGNAIEINFTFNGAA